MYGYPVTAPMFIPEEVYNSPYAPEIPGLNELPIIVAARTEGLRLHGTAAKAMPGMKDAGSMTNVRQLEAAQLANDMRAASDIMKPQAKRSKAIARAKNYQQEKHAKQFGVR